MQRIIAIVCIELQIDFAYAISMANKDEVKIDTHHNIRWICVYVVDGKEIKLCSTDDMSSSTRQIKGFPLVFIGFLCTVFGLSKSPANTI